MLESMPKNGDAITHGHKNRRRWCFGNLRWLEGAHSSLAQVEDPGRNWRRGCAEKPQTRAAADHLLNASSDVGRKLHFPRTGGGVNIVRRRRRRRRRRGRNRTMRWNEPGPEAVLVRHHLVGSVQQGVLVAIEGMNFVKGAVVSDVRQIFFIPNF